MPSQSDRLLGVGDTTSVAPHDGCATAFCRLADEAIAIARTDRYIEARDKIAALLDSVHRMALQEGERRGIARGTKIAADVHNKILDLFRPRNHA